MGTLRYEIDAAAQVVTLTFDDPAAPVNTMSEAWLADLTACLDRLEAESSTTKGVILASAKESFFAGADLKGVLQRWPAGRENWFRRVEDIKRQLRRLERLGRPVVACIAGSALGGGFEVALAAHHRVVIDNRRVQLGCPEVTLGLIPAAGGVTKMVRLLGLQVAMPYIVEGRILSPAQAKSAGLVDELVPQTPDAPAALRAAALAWIGTHPSAIQAWDTRGYKIPGGGPGEPKNAQLLMAAPALLRAKTRGLYPAAEAAFACMVEGAQVDFDTALRLESRALATVADGPVARNLIHLFFDRAAVRAGVSRPRGAPKWKAGKVGVLGAGMMGAGIAYAAARRGVACMLKDVSLERAQAGKAYAATRTGERVAADKMSAQEQTELLALITPAASAAQLRDCDLIIEAVFENRELKAQVTREAEPMLAAGGIFATNTSTLPITGLAKAAAAPERFVGLHFFSPADKMELVEIITGETTSAETLARAYDFVLQIGKTPIVVRDSRGFFTSRTFATYIAEGAQMLKEGIPAAVIEHAGVAAGMPVGPLAVTDEISQATIVAIMEQTVADLAAQGKPDGRSEGERFIEVLCKQHRRLGRVHGGGYYDYPDGAPKSLWPGLQQFEKPGIEWQLAALSERLLMRQALEALRCMSEGVIQTAHDVNVGSIYGIGFPAWTGGAYQYIAGMGLNRFLARCKELAAAHGDRFAPPRLPVDWSPGRVA
ncbi:3-hydroxyacyl-CoA dehydrogenase NAD-binding [Burkholderiales bacterium]|nr:3-hydroxyacyl-CoA dehydrogenase NAD-binding [Burkholderiales bacterium]